MNVPVKEVICRFKNTNGGFSVEAAVVIPLTIAYFVLLIVGISQAYEKQLWLQAAYNTLEETQLCSALNVDEYEHTELGRLLKNKLPAGETALQTLSLQAIELRQNWWYKQLKPTANIRIPTVPPRCNLILQSDESEGLHFTDISYAFYSYLDDYSSKNIYKLPIPVWNGVKFKNLNRNLAEKNKTEESIWSEPQFERGRYFRRLEEANLPDSFPLLSDWRNGTAVSVKSIDLTAPSYRNAAELKRHILNMGQRLNDFEGVTNWGKQGLTIHKEEILHKELRLIIPQNSPMSTFEILNSVKRDLRNKGINLTWKCIGESKRYINMREEE